MKESTYQKKIIDKIKSNGGHAITGVFTTNGEADIQAGISINGFLIHACIEVKTEGDYYRVMKGLKEEGGIYDIVDVSKLKKHEPLQVMKINDIRKKGGIALFAYSYEQVEDYINSHIWPS